MCYHVAPASSRASARCPVVWDLNSCSILPKLLARAVPISIVCNVYAERCNPNRECKLSHPKVPSENGSVAEKKGKWTAALHALSDEERQLFKNLDGEKPALGILQNVLAATLKKKEDCLRKRRKVRIPGREIVIHNVLDKLSAWVTKFIVHRTGICTNATANSCW